MTAAMLTQLLYCFCVLSALLLLGTYLRAVVPFFRKMFLPASVIGGFIGLLAGPIIWRGGGLPIPQEWINTWAALPGLLIIPVVASVPLGMKFNNGEKSAGHTSANIIKMFAIISLIAVVQQIIGLLTRGFFNAFHPALELYTMFGFELSQGFAGGHGTAGVVGSYYRGLDLPYWEIAQGVTTTTATFGLIGGMLIGIAVINIAARRGETAILKKPGDIPVDVAKGYQMLPEKQPSMGRETTYSSSIESLSFHLSIILVGCGIAYVFMNLAKAHKIPGLSVIPIWAYAISVMFLVNFIIQKLGIGSLIDTKTKSKIAGTCSDYAIAAAIASMPVHAIMQYIVPILTMVMVGYVVTFGLAWFLCKLFFDDCCVERSMAVLGTCTGVFLTGLMLLKICDPDYELPVLNDYSVGFSFTSITGFVLLPITVNIILNYSFALSLGYLLAVLAVFFVILLFSSRASKMLAKA